MLFRVLSVIAALAFAFMVAVDVAVLSDNGSIRWGIFIGYLVGTVILGWLAVWLWRRGAHPGAPAA